jgi:hypothetical protein
MCHDISICKEMNKKEYKERDDRIKKEDMERYEARCKTLLSQMGRLSSLFEEEMQGSLRTVESVHRAWVAIRERPELTRFCHLLQSPMKIGILLRKAFCGLQTLFIPSNKVMLKMYDIVEMCGNNDDVLMDLLMFNVIDPSDVDVMIELDGRTYGPGAPLDNQQYLPNRYGKAYSSYENGDDYTRVTSIYMHFDDSIDRRDAIYITSEDVNITGQMKGVNSFGSFGLGESHVTTVHLLQHYPLIPSMIKSCYDDHMKDKNQNQNENQNVNQNENQNVNQNANQNVNQNANQNDVNQNDMICTAFIRKGSKKRCVHKAKAGSKFCGIHRFTNAILKATSGLSFGKQ